ncbi:DEBR0S1_26082g1_1 [Brettanomyces bruxellensis]|uniref:DEBR0S1_26082g1_1 n=1 Tax=Dekkera bruxellensis TaxID=5007 RepID=A0A7D9H080_DEKBR|nr:DEBR0S1_26082g1_1 [Brettanomyces bruxellensis]
MLGLLIINVKFIFDESALLFLVKTRISQSKCDKKNLFFVLVFSITMALCST